MDAAAAIRGRRGVTRRPGVARQGIAQLLRVDGDMFGDAGMLDLQNDGCLPPAFKRQRIHPFFLDAQPVEARRRDAVHAGHLERALEADGGMGGAGFHQDS